MLPETKTILYATGLGAGAPYVFRHALAMARKHQANIVAVHAVEPLPPFGQSLVEHYIAHDVSEEMHRKARESYRVQLQQRLRQLCLQECSGTAECDNLVTSIRVVEGQPAEVILDMAKECSADVIVVGSHRHSVIGEVVLGSTARKVLHGATLPVLVVRIPKGYSESFE